MDISNKKEEKELSVKKNDKKVKEKQGRIHSYQSRVTRPFGQEQ